MLSYKIKLGIVPVRRDVTPRPGIFNWEFAEKRGREITDYIKANFTDELTEFVDIIGVNDVNVMINFDDADFIIDRFKKEKVDGVLFINANFANEEAIGQVAAALRVPSPLSETVTTTLCGVVS